MPTPELARRLRRAALPMVGCAALWSYDACVPRDVSFGTGWGAGERVVARVDVLIEARDG